MREIKFRAYCDNGEGMIYDESEINNKPFYVEKMQFIGLKDKNGKDIYEGDICKNDEGEVGYVEFHEGGFILVLSNTWDPMCPCNHVSLIEEVIGNIYENKKLLD